MVRIDDLKFDERGLIPAIVVDHDSKQVLTLAYMSKESLSISMEKGLTCFWSRSRKKLWLKGETSGHFQHIESITSDCDDDALVVEVIPDGPACHTGTFSCFTHKLYEKELNTLNFKKRNDSLIVYPFCFIWRHPIMAFMSVGHVSYEGTF